MKRKFLIWSAVLTVVFGAALLQSCSADEDTFATEEYGYYTEAENEMVRALAEKYGLCVEINEEYYGSKRSIAEIEEEMKALSSLLGKHELKLVKKENDKLFYTTASDASCPSRVATRTIEGSGISHGTCTIDEFIVSVSVTWRGNGKDDPSISGTASISYKNPSSYDYSSGSLSCKPSGDKDIDFTGWVSYSHCEKVDYFTQKLHYALYHFTINAGQITTPSGSGTFTVTGGKSKDFETNL